jgi:hypothetical protein
MEVALSKRFKFSWIMHPPLPKDFKSDRQGRFSTSLGIIKNAQNVKDLNLTTLLTFPA